jgi:hypothetical protein
MSERAHSASIFSQKLDRVALTAYFLGAVVPLLALGFVLERYVLPTMPEGFVSLGLIALVLSIGLLSLGSFFVLRRTTRTALERMDADNDRLTSLLDAAGALAAVEFADDAPGTSTRAALGLTRSEAAFVLLREEAGAPPQRVAASGPNAEKIEQDLVEPILEMANLVMSSGRLALRGRSGGQPALAAAPLPGEAAPAGALVAVARKDVDEFSAGESGALATLANLGAVAHHNAALREAQRNFFTHVTDMLVTALDAHLGYQTGHGTRVAQFANRVGRQMGLDEHRLERLHFSSLLHDVGMLKLERHQQLNSRTSQKHTLLGGRMLDRIQLWKDLAPIVLHHHEWWDGSGYPEGLSGPSIPLESRIISLCDAFDAMTSSTSYKQAKPFDEAVHEVRAGAGTQFDPDVVGAFEHLVGEGHLTESDLG